MEKTYTLPALLATVALAIPTANAATVLYSSNFSGSSGTNLNGTAVITSGATLAQHAQFGTSATETWTASTLFKADGSFAHSGSVDTTNHRASGTLFFDPQNGYVYTLTMTTNHSVISSSNDWFATGFFMQDNYSGAMQVANGATVWALTRPGSTNVNGDQVAHYNLAGGANLSAVTMLAEDITAPSTITIVLDTTLGTGNWSASYYAGAVSVSNLLRTVADLNAVDIDGVGIGVGLDTSTVPSGRFQSFELSVVPEPSAAILCGLGGLALLRRRR
jgi:hypothetical protein